MAPRELSIALGTGVRKALRDRETVVLPDSVGKRADGQRVRVTIRPLLVRKGRPAYALVCFEGSGDANPAEQPFDLPGQAAQRIRDLESEVERTRENLQAAVEELETSNEELRATNEEVLAANEELQSTNEELQTVNEELRTRTAEVNHANAFFASVLGSLPSGAVVVNRNLDVMSWNPRAEDLWGLRADEVQGKSLLNLDIGLPVKELRDAIRPVLAGDMPQKEVVLDAVNRRGKSIRCRVSATPLLSGKERQGVILLMDELA
jgi:two-component system CheB/CheR fusion protein